MLNAHADLGTGDCGLHYLLTELLGEPPQNRASPRAGDDGLGDGNYLEPSVPFDWSLWHEYQATEPFDLICLARSRPTGRQRADAVYDEIRSRFIDENAMARPR